MKKATCLMLLLGFTLNLCAQDQAPNGATTNSGISNLPPTAVYSVATRAANSRVWQRAVSVTNRIGKVLSRTNSYTELATGLHVWNGTQWMDANDRIQITANGAAATNTQHQVQFAPNLNTVGAINLTTPDGQQMASHILGLSYFDSVTSNSILFAQLQDSIGQLLPSGNQIIYTNAFTNANCDVLYTHRLAGFEQDIVIRQQLPPPASFGLTGSNIWLQVWTEFTTAPTPKITPMTNGDSLLDFGTMRMRTGRAFMIGAPSNSVRVVKNWVTTQGRTFLIESVPLNAIAAKMAQLPSRNGQSGGSTNSGSGGQSSIDRRLSLYASTGPLVDTTRLKLPSPKLAKKHSGTIRLAAAQPKSSGLVLDYNTYNSGQSDLTFQGDSTYLISGEVDVSGTATFEGGTVIKFGSSGTETIVPDVASFETSLYRPAILTGSDDDSVGQQIRGSSGNPTGTSYGAIVLDLSSDYTINDISNVRFFFLNTALAQNGNAIRNTQFVQCGAMAGPNDTTLQMYNVLAYNVGPLLSGEGDLSGQSIRCDNCTLDNCGALGGDPTGTIASFNNCILNSVGSAPGLILGNHLSVIDPGSSTFQTVGAGTHYLADNTYRGAGSASFIDSTLQAELPLLTTYPPQVYTSTNFSNNIVLSTTSIRDTGGNPDLGYHYPAIDYAMGDALLTNATMTINSNTVIASFDPGTGTAGLTVGTGAQLICQGTPVLLNRVVAFNTVQDFQYGSGWNSPTNGLLQPNPTANAPASVIKCRFTDFSVIAQDDPHLNDVGGNTSPVGFQDCQFHGGSIYSTNVTVNLTNCLLERVNATLQAYDANAPVIRNNLFLAGGLDLYVTNANSVVQDNLFDQTTIDDHGITDYVGTYNGYLVNSNCLTLTNGNDVFLSASPAYQSGPLGNYYQPTSDSLFQVGNTNASLLGLYQYTTQTNQVKEGTNIVTIGYHYVAVDESGNPIDTNNDGVPDYIADANGNGLWDNGEIDWMIMLTDPNNIGPTGLQVYTPLKY